MGDHVGCMISSYRRGEAVKAAQRECRDGKFVKMAERVGFEPTVEFPLHSLSRRALSTAQTPLRASNRFK